MVLSDVQPNSLSNSFSNGFLCIREPVSLACNIFRVILRWRTRYEVSRVFLNLFDILTQINILSLDDLGSFQDLPAKVQHWEHSDHGIREEKIRNLPVPMNEDGVAVKEYHGDAPGEGIPCQERLPPALVRKSAT